MAEKRTVKREPSSRPAKPAASEWVAKITFRDIVTGVVYQKGAPYEGTPDRIEALSSTKNQSGKILIEKASK